MGYRQKLSILLGITLIAFSGFTQNSFSIPIGDDENGTPNTIPGPDPLVQSFDIEFLSGLGPLEKDFNNFPDVLTPPTTVTETITNNRPNTAITSYKEIAFRDTGQSGHWDSASITLQDSSTCSVTSPALTNTCGDITITISSSGGNPAGSNDIVVFEFHNNPQFFGDTFVIQNTLSYQTTTTGNTLLMKIHELANTELAPPPSGYSLQESLLIPVDGSTVVSTTTLLSGTDYKIRATGTGTVGTNTIGDAEYTVESPGGSDIIRNNCDSGQDLGISINDPVVDNSKLPFWGAFNPTHVYETDFAGLDSTISLRYHDCNYGDNTSETITVEIFAPQAPVGSFSIPIESTQMLVVATSVDSVLTTLVIVGIIGIGILVATRLRN